MAPIFAERAFFISCIASDKRFNTETLLEEHRDYVPEKHRDHVPKEHRDHVPKEHRDYAPEEHRDGQFAQAKKAEF